MRRTFLRAAAALLTFLSSSALVPAEGFDAVSVIGMSPREVFQALGAPREVFSQPGASEREEDVVFFYPDCTYLFLHGSRVWQVRCDRRFNGTVLGLSLGMSRGRVTERMGDAVFERGSSLYYDVEGGSYPTRLRLVFAGGALSDLYVYRSDF